MTSTPRSITGPTAVWMRAPLKATGFSGCGWGSAASSPTARPGRQAKQASMKQRMRCPPMDGQRIPESTGYIRPYGPCQRNREGPLIVRRVDENAHRHAAERFGEVAGRPGQPGIDRDAMSVPGHVLRFLDGMAVVD